MTVKDLIEKLKEMPEDAEVEVYDGDVADVSLTPSGRVFIC